jgi:hypothetical protein
MISVLLPFHLSPAFKVLFEKAGFLVYWSANQTEFEQLIRTGEFDVALEWPRASDDHMVRDFLNKSRRNTPIILGLNWNYKKSANWAEHGYAASLQVPFVMADFALKLWEVLPAAKSDEAYRIYINLKR